MLHIERIEPVVRVLEERIALELGECAHIYIGAFQLQFVHFTYLVTQAGFFECFFPIRVTVVFIHVFFEAVLHVTHDTYVLHHLRDDFFTHLLVYLLRLLTAEQLDVNPVQLFAEAAVFIEKR